MGGEPITITNLITAPKLKEPFPSIPGMWTCPVTGLKVPKNIAANLRYREDLLRKAEHDIGLQEELMRACHDSILYFVNTFVWTFKQFDVFPDGTMLPAAQSHVPMVTWDIQDIFFDELVDAVETGHDLGIKKSRDMGASWCCLVLLHKYWLFHGDCMMLELSRTEDYVDKTGNPKALFWKHDYINSWLPEWMCPPGVLPNQPNRTKMHLFNPLMNSIIDGESTTKHAASGDRRKIVLLDEFAKVENGEAMRSATADVTPCRIVNSTPAGAGTEYSDWINSGRIKVFMLPWYEHPQKGHGRYAERNEKTNEWEIKSPWFNKEVLRRSPKVVAQEILMQDIESGDVFFNIPNLRQHKDLFARKPESIYNIDFKKNVTNEEIPKIIKTHDTSRITVKKNSKGSLSLWTKLLLGKVDQNKTYIFGIDTSRGMGASNSIISILCVETMEKIGEWADANVLPYDFARIIIAIALWIGGTRPRRIPFLIWEKNGPGWEVGKLLVKKYKYPYYYRTRTVGKVTTKATDKYGYHTSSQSKRELLQTLDAAYAQTNYVNHSLLSLDEAERYIEFPGGGVGPAGLARESKSARLTHGDRVIGDALTLEAVETAPKLRRKAQKAPFRSVAYRKKLYDEKRKKAKGAGPWRCEFDFEQEILI
ncbi:hypothetical protein LCGC14_0487370 [marine sediment metagenome]|uniref:Terminase large subunit gp17-like C-terminal domain-containing protein n=1 Tax=marine sediment metagenome TaxID=412755 RepID=A0A0F9VGJ2_9ZZZZ